MRHSKRWRGLLWAGGGIDKFRTSVTKTVAAKTMARRTRYPGY